MLALAVSSACTIPQSDECAKYVDCAAHYDSVQDTETDTSTYAADGSCWQNAETADSCTEACGNATTALADALEAADEDVGDCG